MQVIGSAGEPVTTEVQHGFPVMAAHAFQIQVWQTTRGHDIQAPYYANQASLSGKRL
jgi:hypothetical protein